MKKKSEFWQTLMIFVWVVLVSRDHNTGIKVMSLPSVQFWFQLVWIFLKVTAVLWANTCNLLRSGRIGKELLLNFCKYALLALLQPAVLEEIIFFLFAVYEIFLFL